MNKTKENSIDGTHGCRPKSELDIYFFKGRNLPKYKTSKVKLDAYVVVERKIG